MFSSVCLCFAHHRKPQAKNYTNNGQQTNQIEIYILKKACNGKTKYETHNNNARTKVGNLLKFNFDAFTQEKIPCGNLFRVLYYISPKRISFFLLFVAVHYTSLLRSVKIFFCVLLSYLLLVYCILARVFAVHLGSNFFVHLWNIHTNSYSYVTHFCIVHCNCLQCTATTASSEHSMATAAKKLNICITQL